MRTVSWSLQAKHWKQLESSKPKKKKTNIEQAGGVGKHQIM